MNTETNADKDLITIEEFRRRILDRDRAKDPLAHMVSRKTIEAKIKLGYMETEEHNGRKWLDWNKYKEMPFRAYFGLPKRIENTRTATTRADVVAIYSKPVNKEA